MTSESFRIVDDFYNDPLAVREEALNAVYQPDEQYGGFDSVKSFHADEAMRKIEKVLGVQIRWDNITGYFHLSTAKDRGPFDIHADTMLPENPFPQWTGVCYLTLPKDCQGGTSFWRHNKTGLTRYPNTEEKDKVSQTCQISNTTESMVHYFIIQEGHDRSRWTQVEQIPMAFNRLILLRSNLFHSHTCHFGDSRENGRLTQVFGCDEVDYVVQRSLSRSHLTVPLTRTISP